MAEAASAEPAAKKVSIGAGSSGMTPAAVARNAAVTGSSNSHASEAAAVASGGAGRNVDGGQQGDDVEMVEGDAAGATWRHVVRLRRTSAAKAVGDRHYGIKSERQAMDES